MLYFNCGVDVNNYYYNLDQSVQIANELLLFQFNNNIDRLREFLNKLYEIVDKVVEIIYLFALSPPNAGKKYFFDGIHHYFLNFGQIGNYDKYNNFIDFFKCIITHIDTNSHLC